MRTLLPPYEYTGLLKEIGELSRVTRLMLSQESSVVLLDEGVSGHGSLMFAISGEFSDIIDNPRGRMVLVL